MTTLELEGITEADAILADFNMSSEELRRVLTVLGTKCRKKGYVEEELARDPNAVLQKFNQVHCRNCWGYKTGSHCNGTGYSAQVR